MRKTSWRWVVLTAVFVLPGAFNACGKFQSSHDSSLSSSSLSSYVAFDRLSVPAFAKSAVALSGNCIAGQSISIQVDALPAETVGCAAGTFSHSLQLTGADGPKVIVVTAQYASRVYKDSITVTKDTVPPTVSIINAVPAGPYVVISGSCENGDSLIPGGDITSISIGECTNGIFQVSVLLRSATAAQSIEISQIDKAGNRGTGTLTYSPDVTLPNLVISAPTANAFVKAVMPVAGLCEVGLPVNVTSASLAQPLDISCVAGAFSSTLNVDGADGAKTFVFKQTDAAGNKAEKTLNVTKDTIPPVLTVAAPAAGASLTTDSVTVRGTCETGLAVMIQGTGVSAAVSTACAAASFSASVNFSSGNGSKTLDIVQTDAAGNQTKISRTVTKTAPMNNLTITQPAAESYTKSGVTLTGTCDTGATVSFAGQIQTTASVTCANGVFSRAITLSVPDGTKTVTVSQSLNGTVSSTTRNFILDTLVPSLSILNPVAGSNVKSNFTVSGVCESGLQVALSGAGLSAAKTATCAGGSYSATVTASTGSGAKSFSVAQTDAAGNSASISRSVNVVATATLLTIVQPIANEFVKSTALVSGACETGLTVALSGSIQPINANCSLGLYSATVTFTADDGQKTIQVQQTDANGNVASATRAVTKDTVAPILTITSPMADSKAETGVTVVGTCETGLTVKASGAGVASDVSAPCVAKSYTVSVIFSGGDGVKVVVISSTDSAGNVTSVSRQFIKGTVDLFPSAKAVLDQYCVKCHGPGGQASYADFTLSTPGSFIDKGYVVAGDIDKSKLIYRMVHYSGSTGGVARNMPLNATSTFPISAYDTLVNWVKQMSPVAPPAANPFTCNDPNAISPSLSYVLTKDQYQNSVTDLFGAAALNGLADILSGLPNETFDPTSNQRISALSAGKIDSYFNLAKGIAANVVASTSMSTAVFGTCAQGTAPAATCIDTYINGFAKKLFRRPLTSAEATDARAIANRGGDYKANIRTLLALHLQSPPFLWRLETGAASQTSTTVLQLTPYEVATRIAYMTTDSTPDALLMQAADANQLATVAQVQTQVKRLLQTARGKLKARKNLLRYGRADKAEDVSTLPAELKQGVVTDGLATAMTDEAAAYVDYSLYNQNASFQTLLTSKASFASHAGLAAIYGHAPIASGGAPATFAGRRQGLLMRAPFLASTRIRTKLIIRGVTFQKYALCNEIPPPSSAVADLREAQVFTPEELLNHTTREAIAYQTAQPICMTCHTTINPTGFSFENFDSLGRIRVSELIFDINGKFARSLPIDTTANVPIGTTQVPVTDAYDAVTAVANSPDGAACFTKQIYRYINEKRESAEDGCELSKVHKLVMDPTKPVLDALTEVIGNTSLFVKRN